MQSDRRGTSTFATPQLRFIRMMAATFVFAVLPMTAITRGQEAGTRQPECC